MVISDISDLKTRLVSFPKPDGDQILDAAQWAGSLVEKQKDVLWDSSSIYPLSIAFTLIDMQMDTETVIASLLYNPAIEYNLDPAEIQSRYGTQVESLVNGMKRISVIKAQTKTAQEAEIISKTLFAMTQT